MFFNAKAKQDGSSNRTLNNPELYQDMSQDMALDESAEEHKSSRISQISEAKAENDLNENKIAKSSIATSNTKGSNNLNYYS